LCTAPCTAGVFKKASPNGKLTVYLGKRDFVDHIDVVDPVVLRPQPSRPVPTLCCVPNPLVPNPSAVSPTLMSCLQSLYYVPNPSAMSPVPVPCP
uniref:Uncharacterized protein n=1 Tax=Meleagris gallopavo TaxID=9103 RepID=A0A803XSL3_MELGA